MHDRQGSVDAIDVTVPKRPVRVTNKWQVCNRKGSHFGMPPSLTKAFKKTSWTLRFHLPGKIAYGQQAIWRWRAWEVPARRAVLSSAFTKNFACWNPINPQPTATEFTPAPSGVSLRRKGSSTQRDNVRAQSYCWNGRVEYGSACNLAVGAAATALHNCFSLCHCSCLSISFQNMPNPARKLMLDSARLTWAPSRQEHSSPSWHWPLSNRNGFPTKTTRAQAKLISPWYH